MVGREGGRLLLRRRRRGERSGRRGVVAWNRALDLSSHVNTYWGLTYHSTNLVGGMGTRCLIKYAAGKPEPRVMNPKILKVHAVPMLSSSALSTKLITAPPSPPAAYTIPFAIPRLVLKYCAGVIETTMKQTLSDCVSFVLQSVFRSFFPDHTSSRYP